MPLQFYPMSYGYSASGAVTYTYDPVPEPGTLALLVGGLAVLIAGRRK